MEVINISHSFQRHTKFCCFLCSPEMLEAESAKIISFCFAIFHALMLYFCLSTIWRIRWSKVCSRIRWSKVCSRWFSVFLLQLPRTQFIITSRTFLLENLEKLPEQNFQSSTSSRKGNSCLGYLILAVFNRNKQ